MIELYHGATHIIERPDCGAGRENLDFGKGFYMTADVALAELSKHRPDNQVCILNQELADGYLKFRKYYICE